MQKLKSFIRSLLLHTPFQYIPVTVRRGLAKGARWTIFPYSSNWRGNVELDIESAVSRYGSLYGSVCWDFGAHFGIYTVGMAIAVGPEGHVYSFEPDRNSYERCLRHVAMNHLSWVRVFNAGVSDHDGTLDLIVSTGSGAATAHFAYEDEKVNPDTRRIQVKLLALDPLVEKGEVLPPHFIKVDVEGHGAKALRGAARTVAASKPIMVMSFHSIWERDETQALLEPIGYKAFDFDGREIGWDASLYRSAILWTQTPGNGATAA